MTWLTEWSYLLVMPDVATLSLKSILDSDDFEFIDDIPIFDAHEEADSKGNVLRRFDKKKLEKIAAVGNERIKNTGDLAPIGPGHTISNAPETRQPPIWGYIGNYKVGVFGPTQKVGILAGLYMKKRVEIPNDMGGVKVVSGREVLKEFPRRSVELWFNDDMIDWLGLLRRTPERDLGLTAYQKGKLRYAMEDHSEPEGANVMTPGEGVTPEELADDERRIADRYMCHYMKSNSLFKYLKHKYSDEADQYAAYGGPMNAGMPTSTAKEPIRMSKENEKILTVQEYDALKAENDDLRKKLADNNTELLALKTTLAMSARHAQYSKELIELAKDKDFNVDEELAYCSDMEPEKFAKHKERITKCYTSRRSPDELIMYGPMIRTADPPQEDKPLEEKDLQLVLQDVRKGKSWEEAYGKYQKRQ